MMRVVGLLLVVGMVLLVACGGEAAEAPTPTPVPWQAELQEQVAAWEARGIEDYAMRVELRRPGWHVQEFRVTVVGGEPQVESHDCFPERNCAVREVDPALLTVAHVIDEALSLAQTGQIEHLVYHEEYDFPRIVAARDADGWQISEFTVGGGR